mgnify:CR=1 FL=1
MPSQEQLDQLRNEAFRLVRIATEKYQAFEATKGCDDNVRTAAYVDFMNATDTAETGLLHLERSLEGVYPTAVKQVSES